MIYNIQENVAKSKALKSEVDNFLKSGGRVKKQHAGYSGYEDKSGGAKVKPETKLRGNALTQKVKSNRKHADSPDLDKARKNEQVRIIGGFLRKTKINVTEFAGMCGLSGDAIYRASKGLSLMKEGNWVKVKEVISKLEKKL